MKIAHLIYDLSPGGAERFVVDLASEQCAAGHDVTVVCVNALDCGKRLHYREDLHASIKLISLGGEGRLSLGLLNRIGFFFRRECFDLVHAHTFPLVVYPVALMCNTPIVLTFHSVAEYYTINPLFTRFDRLLFRSKRIKAVTIAQSCHESFEKVYGLSSDTMICNGRSPMAVTQEFDAVKAEVKSYNPDGLPVFVHVARFSKEKNQTMLYEAFKKLSSDSVGFILLIIGSDYPRQFIQMVEKLPGIHVLGAKHNVADYLGVSKYFVMTSLFEGLPISLLEAMSMGCIPISTPAGGVADVVVNGITGYLSEDFDDISFSNAIKHALNESSPVNAESVRREYLSRYTIEVCAEQYMSVYKSLSR